ncbi:MAG TPA: rod shape-determining protein MreC [Bryobacteraceae bacterium]|nr:rod shape-determining protein MreC [Bryobacteraceae bacterium]
METFLNRYRNITVLLLVIFAQLVLVAVQVRNDQDVRLVRIWTITAITPLARILETARSGTLGFVSDYVLMHDERQDNRRLQTELDRLKMENQFLKSEISTADRAKALLAFEARTPSKTIAARVIAAGAGADSKVVFLDRGSRSGVEKGMPVVTPDGIVGEVIAAYPTASEVMLVTDPEFAAGVVSQKNHVAGTLKGQGQANCKVDYVPNEEKVDIGEWFYTSGDDRIFPKGFPVGVVRVVRKGSPYQEILVEPTGMARGLEAVLIVVEGVHQEIPEAPPANAPVYIGTPPPAAPGTQPATESGIAGTAADRLIEKYREIGTVENHKYGEGGVGAKPPDFNIKLPTPGSQPPAGAAPNGAAKPPASAPPATKSNPPAAAPETPPAQPKTQPQDQ